MRLLVLLTLTASCATRHVPKTFPATAAVSPDAPSAPAADIGTVVRDEPPLPGEPTTGWPAFEASHAP